MREKCALWGFWSAAVLERADIDCPIRFDRAESQHFGARTERYWNMIARATAELHLPAGRAGRSAMSEGG